MANEIVLASGSSVDGLRAASEAVDSQIAHGEIGIVRIRMIAIPAGVVSAIQYGLELSGVKLIEPVSTEPGHVIVIKYRRNPGPLVIVGVILAVGVLLLITGWTLSKVKETAPVLGSSVVLIVGALAVAAAVAGRKG